MCLKIKRSLEKAKERKTMKYQETREKVLEVAVKQRFDSWNGRKRIYESSGRRCCNYYS